jgi:hypothetical protein
MLSPTITLQKPASLHHLKLIHAWLVFLLLQPKSSSQTSQQMPINILGFDPQTPQMPTTRWVIWELLQASLFLVNLPRRLAARNSKAEADH